MMQKPRLRFPALVCLTILVLGINAQAAKNAGNDVGNQSLQPAIEARALRFFLDHSNLTSGLVRDSADNFVITPATNRMASMAATGFGLAVVVNAGTRAMIDKTTAYDYALKTLRFSRDHVPRYKGWFVHFADWQTGQRLGNSEFSTIDTALFLGGALYAAQAYPKTEVAQIANELYAETNFNEMLTDGGAKPGKLTLSMAYSPETGFTPAQWSMPAEQMLLLLLGLGHPTHPLSAKTWLAWDRQFKTLPDGERISGYNMPLFTHQYSELFIDMRHFQDEYMNYFNNEVLATKLNRDTCLKDNDNLTFRDGFWGLSAGESPTGYSVNDPSHISTTACLGCAIGSAMYAPNEIIGDASRWLKSPLRAKIWGHYGFIDSVDIDHNWFASNVLGITVGPAFMSLANTNEETSIWHLFREIPAMRRALAIAETAR